MRAVEAAGQAVLQTVLVHFVEELSVLERAASSATAGGQHAALVLGQQRVGRDAEHADRRIGNHHRETDVLGRRAELQAAFADGVPGRAFTIGGWRLSHVHERLPLPLDPRHHPHAAVGHQHRDVRAGGGAHRVEIGEARQGVAERHQAGHLVGALRCLAAGLRRVVGLERQLAPAVELIEAEDERNDDDRGRGLQVEALVQPADTHEGVRERPGQQHVAREGYAGGQERTADS